MAQRRPGKILQWKSSRLAAVAVVAAAVTALAACGSSSKSSGSGTTPTGSGSSASAIDVAGAKAEMQKLLKPVAVNYNPGPLGGSVAGKTVAIVADTTPSGRHAVDLVTQYAQELGLKTKTYNGGSSAEQLTNAMEQIVNDANAGKVDAVLVDGKPPTAWLPQFNALLAKKIPVGDWAIPDDPSYDDKLTTITQSLSTGTGDIEGYAVDWMIADANGPVNAVGFTIPSYPVLKVVGDAFKSEFQKRCPSSEGCQVDLVNLDLAGLGSTMPGAIVSYLQAHPKVKYVFLDFSDMMIGVPAALKAAGITGVKFVSQSADQGTAANIRSGAESAEFTYPFALIYRVMLDALARAMLGKSTAASKGWKFPTQLMDKSNVDGGTFNPDGTTNPPGVQEFFKGIWTS
jgi:ribose transport system substrate-binding protein